MYWLIHGSEDGTKMRRFKNAKSLLACLSEEGWASFRDEDSDMDTNYWDESECLILLAQTIIPKPKAITTEWDLGEADTKRAPTLSGR